MGVRSVDDQTYLEFQRRFTELCFDIFGETPIKWVVPILAYDKEMNVTEDILVPEEQLVQDTLGLLRWAQVQLEVSISTREDDD